MIYRVYYNNSQDAQRWSVDEGTTESEITVIDVRLEDVRADSASIDVGEQPHAWFTVDGYLSMDAGVAVFRSYAPGT